MDIKVLALPQLVPMLITLVSVFILYLILRKYLYTPVVEFLEKRKIQIKSDIEEAKSLKSEALDLKADYEARIAEAKKEAQEILENSRQRGNEIRENIILEARQEAQSIIDRARKDIEREKDKAYEDIKKYTGEMAVLIASKIMEENITLEDHKLLIDKFIDEVGSTKWQN